ncbi:uncharacterized protein LOC114299261 isoform X2 [Camellia sinensis]|uniref:uncharacterized protein LOC114299261 isoform X2 n=1 Tax=Camellia sinensis TaxID=4442 RepID=UPI001035511C|nr:uncharacterized protein LOC114299261 isoform X2 [Camellia sinensis]XP_028099781.1 uncharacterized protein LOC114299261 isoform X2 [Camellia sinensis]
MLSLDLIEKWFSQNFNDSILKRGGSKGLSISGIATYQLFDGIPKLNEDKNFNSMPKRQKSLKSIGLVKHKRPTEVEHSMKVARTKTGS